MPLMCKEAVELAANTFAVISGKKVQVTVYNSDPVSPPPQQDNCDIKLNINEIYKITYNGYKSMEELLLKFVLDYNINNNYYENKLIKDVNAYISQDDLKCLYKLSKAVSSRPACAYSTLLSAFPSFLSSNSDPCFILPYN
jgi:hypothetical protein